jgi:hypothetical protein
MAEDSQEVGPFAGGAQPRRSFLRKASVTVLGAAAGLVGLQRPASATYQAYCCTLEYNPQCTPKQWSSCGDKWSWTCCGYVGSSLTRVSCDECNSYKCSRADFVGSC